MPDMFVDKERSTRPVQLRKIQVKHWRHQEATPSAYRSATGEAVADEHVDDGVSIHDERFRDGFTEYGLPYVARYLDTASKIIGNAEVDGFELHDEKEFLACADRFGTRYNLLLPVTEPEANAGGFNDALALLYHDIIEDGIDAVVNSLDSDFPDNILPGEYPKPSTREEILSDPRWKHVRGALIQKSDILDIPREHGAEHFEFYRTHTALKEADDTGDPMMQYDPHIYDGVTHLDVPEDGREMQRTASAHIDQKLEEKMIGHAQRSQEHLYGEVVDDPALIEDVQDNYLKAVQAHDTHTPEAQEANRNRRSHLHKRVLSRMIADRYGDDLPQPDRGYAGSDDKPEVYG